MFDVEALSETGTIPEHKLALSPGLHLPWRDSTQYGSCHQKGSHLGLNGEGKKKSLQLKCALLWEVIPGESLFSGLRGLRQFITQHSTGHQDVEERLCIPAIVKLSARGIEELRNCVQISASLVQALHDTFLKLRRVKSLLFIYWSKHTKTHTTLSATQQRSQSQFKPVIGGSPLFRVLKRWPVSVGFCCFWLFIKDT